MMIMEAGTARGAAPTRRMPAVSARVLAALNGALLAVASAAGLFVPSLYQDPEPVRALLRGYDLTTLVLAVPMLAVALLPALRHSARARLVTVAVLAYVVYTYASYVFGTAFNDLFLLHVAVFSTAIFALALALATIDPPAIADRFHVRTPARTVGAVLVVLGLTLGAMWAILSLRFAVTDVVPEEPSGLILPTSFTHLGWALDLSLLVPGYVLAGLLLWRRAAWGYVLAALLVVSGTLHQVAYLTALVFQTDAGIPGASAFDPGEVPIVVAFVAAAVLLLVNCDRPASARVAAPPDR
jgi:hypothetical protein